MSVRPEARSLVAALILGACSSSSVAAPPDPAAIMLGEWSYDRSPPVGESPSLNTGFHVQIAIDSVRGRTFWGRVVFWLSGDVVIAVSQFGRLVGSVDDHQDVQLTIPQALSAEASIRLTGNVVGDALTVKGCTSGESPGPFAVGAVFERRE